MFERFALAATFDSAAWDSFVATQKAIQRNTSQQLSRQRHYDHQNHYNDWDHRDTHTDRTSHSQSWKHTNKPAAHNQRHSQTPHSDRHTNYHDKDASRHYNQWGDDHVNRHDNTYGHINAGRLGDHYNKHVDWPSSHNNGHAHWDKYTQNHNNVPSHGQVTHDQSIPYEQYNQYQESYPYTQSGYDQDIHDNSRPHSNTGFDHDNYIPSKPAVFNVPARAVGGILQVGLYSYDKNQDGYGSSGSYAENVYYDLSIRKVKNLDGTPNVKSEIYIVSNAAEPQKGKGLVVQIDTTKYEEGIYELKAVARNQQRGGYTYNSPATTVTLIIAQNQPPEVTVENATEFINFIFGYDGVLTSSGTFREYSEKLYAGAPDHQQEGLFVAISMKDYDIATYTYDNWQKAQVYLRRANGTEISGTRVDVIWTDTGSTITQSRDGQVKQGRAFIPLAKLTAEDVKNGVLVVEVTDYKDAACTQPAGTTVKQTTVSPGGGQTLTVHVDISPPTISVNNTTYGTWIKTIPSIVLTFQDAVSGVAIQEYAWSTDGTTPPDAWTPYTGPLTPPQGKHYLWARAVDRMGQETVKVFGPYWIDTNAPDINVEIVPYEGTRRVRVSVKDDISRLKTIRWPDGTTIDLSGQDVAEIEQEFTFTGHTQFSVTATDQAGNSRTVTGWADFKPPIVTADNTSSAWQPYGTKVTLTYYDEHSEVVTKQYQWTSSTDQPSGGWLPYTGPVTIPEGKASYLWYRAVDAQGNEVIGRFGPYNVDKTAPEVSFEIEWISETQRRIRVTAVDPISGVHRIVLPNNQTVYSDQATYTVTATNTYTFKVYDVAGNVYTLNVLVDLTKPVVTADITSTAWTNQDVLVNLTFSDQHSGIAQRQYAINQNPTVQPAVWNDYTGPVRVSQDGQNYIWYRAVDHQGNTAIGYFGPYRVDKTPPEATATVVELGLDLAEITVTATDAHSGVKQIQLPDGRIVNGAQATYQVTTDGTYYFIIYDNAGNTYELGVVAEFRPIISDLVLVTTPNPPEGLSLPLQLPVDSPQPIKAGYVMRFVVKTRRAEWIDVYVSANGQPISVFTDSGPVSSIREYTATTDETYTEFSFWLDPNMPKDTIIDLKIVATRIANTPEGQLEKVTEELDMGYHFGIVTGSAWEDSIVNQTR